MTSRCLIAQNLPGLRSKCNVSVRKSRALPLCSYLKLQFLFLISDYWLLEAVGSAGASAAHVALSLRVILCDAETGGYSCLDSFKTFLIIEVLGSLKSFMKEATATGDTSAHLCFFQSVRGREYRHAVCLKGTLSRLFQLEKGLDLDDCSVMCL